MGARLFAGNLIPAFVETGSVSESKAANAALHDIRLSRLAPTADETKVKENGRRRN